MRVLRHSARKWMNQASRQQNHGHNRQAEKNGVIHSLKELHGFQARLLLLHTLLFTAPALNPPPPLAGRRSPPPAPPPVLDDAKLDPSPPLSLRLLISDMCSLAPPLTPPETWRELDEILAAIPAGTAAAAADSGGLLAALLLSPPSLPAAAPVLLMLPDAPRTLCGLGLGVALPSETSVVSRYPPPLPSLPLPGAARRLPPVENAAVDGRPCWREVGRGAL